MRRAQLKAIGPQDDGEQSDEEEKEEEEKMKKQQPGCISAGRGKTSCKPGNLVKCVKRQMACKAGAEGEQMGIM